MKYGKTIDRPIKPIKNADYKVYFKKEGCSMCIFKNLTFFAARHRVKVLTNIYADWNGKFIVTL